MRSYAVVIPVREFQNTKLRLSSRLNESERGRLTWLLLKRVLLACHNSQANLVVVVASDPAQARKQLREFSSKVIIIKEPEHHGGVNLAMRKGAKKVLALKPGCSLLLIPSDLPFLTSAALDKVANLLDKYDLLIGPSAKLDGTSLLAFSSKKQMIPLHYDDDSYEKHSREATRLKMKFKILKTNEFSFDVDTPQDLRKLMEKLGASDVRELFQRLEEKES